MMALLLMAAQSEDLFLFPLQPANTSLLHIKQVAFALFLYMER